MIIAFAGHAHDLFDETVKKAVMEKIRAHITDAEHVTCYLGGYGAFDELCAVACRELKRTYHGMEIIYVTPYMSLSQQKKVKEVLHLGLYDDSIYPPIENAPPRLAIIKRNEWMMSNADLVIAYVNRSYGGAYQALQVAKRKNKKIINICDYL